MLCLLSLALLLGPAVAAPADEKFIQISGISYDSHYLYGTSPLYYCHRASGQAGIYGSRNQRCGSSSKLLSDALAWTKLSMPDMSGQLSSEFKFLLWTGNSVRDVVDDQVVLTELEVQDTLTDISTKFKRLFHPSIPVLPAIGASDLYPNGKVIEKDPQLARLSTLWNDFLSPHFEYDNTNVASFQKWGVYAVEQINGEPLGFTVLVLNPEFWAASNPKSTTCNGTTAPGAKVFEWARGKLLDAQSAGTKVLLTGHRPPTMDGEYRMECREMYEELAAQFQDTIMGHVFGSMKHEDSFELIDQHGGDGLAHVGVIHSAPPLLPDHNPAVRVYEYKESSLTDYVQYYADLDAANKAGDISFLQEYRASQSYQLDQAKDWTKQWEQLSKVIETDDSMYQQYELHRTVMAEAPPPRSALIGIVFSSLCGALVLLSALWAVWKCKQFKHKTYEQELAEGLI